MDSIKKAFSQSFGFVYKFEEMALKEAHRSMLAKIAIVAACIVIGGLGMASVQYGSFIWNIHALKITAFSLGGIGAICGLISFIGMKSTQKKRAHQPKIIQAFRTAIIVSMCIAGTLLAAALLQYITTMSASLLSEGLGSFIQLSLHVLGMGDVQQMPHMFGAIILVAGGILALREGDKRYKGSHAWLLTKALLALIPTLAFASLITATGASLYATPGFGAMYTSLCLPEMMVFIFSNLVQSDEKQKSLKTLLPHRQEIDDEPTTIQ